MGQNLTRSRFKHDRLQHSSIMPRRRRLLACDGNRRGISFDRNRSSMVLQRVRAISLSSQPPSMANASKSISELSTKEKMEKFNYFQLIVDPSKSSTFKSVPKNKLESEVSTYLISLPLNENLRDSKLCRESLEYNKSSLPRSIAFHKIYPASSSQDLQHLTRLQSPPM